VASRNFKNRHKHGNLSRKVQNEKASKGPVLKEKDQKAGAATTISKLPDYLDHTVGMGGQKVGVSLTMDGLSSVREEGEYLVKCANAKITDECRLSKEEDATTEDSPLFKSSTAISPQTCGIASVSTTTNAAQVQQ
jgi:hypothetical protein